MTGGTARARFEAYDVALELVRALRGPLAVLRQHDRDLDEQVRRAANSTVLNVAEGRQRAGRDRVHQFRVALGSTCEVAAVLDAGCAWGWLSEGQLGEVRGLLDRERAMLWRLVNGRGG